MSSPLRVLLVSRYFPPCAEVGGLRPARLVDALRQRGHLVTVVTVDGSEGAPGTPDPGVRYVRPSAGPRDWLVGAKRTLRGAVGGPAPSVAFDQARPPEPGIAAVLATIKRWLISLAWTPDDHHGFILPALRAALRELDRERYDLLFTTAPPFSAHLVGLIASRLSGVRWVSEFRDPWVYEGRRPAELRSVPAEALDRWMERLCLSASREVVAVTYRAAGLLAERRRAMGLSEPIVVLNGLPEVEVAPPSGTGPIRILHAGNLYGGRDPRAFFATLARLRDQGRLPAEGVVVDMIGDADSYEGISLRDVVARLGLADLVSFPGRIPHREMLARQGEADVLLLLAQRQPMQVPNKLYEYLGAQRPILAYVDATGESLEMLERAGNHFVVTEESRDPDAVVATALAAARNAWAPANPEVLRAWRSETQMAVLVDALERAARGG